LGKHSGAQGQAFSLTATKNLGEKDCTLESKFRGPGLKWNVPTFGEHILLWIEPNFSHNSA